MPEAESVSERIRSAIEGRDRRYGEADRPARLTRRKFRRLQAITRQLDRQYNFPFRGFGIGS